MQNPAQFEPLARGTTVRNVQRIRPTRQALAIAMKSTSGGELKPTISGELGKTRLAGYAAGTYKPTAAAVDLDRRHCEIPRFGKSENDSQNQND
jgi:hypothetical protein